MQQKAKRLRGVVLTPKGGQRLQGAIHEFELSQQRGVDFRCSQEKLCAHIISVHLGCTLTPITLGKVLNYRKGVDLGTIQKVFAAFNLKLEDDDYYYPEQDYQRQEDTIVPKRQYWGQAIDVSFFSGRVEELVTLNQWLLEDRCRLVALFGMGGIGKTSIAAMLARQIQDKFEYVYWLSLLDAPSIEAILNKLIQFLSDEQETNIPESLGDQVSLLIDYLYSKRCLLIFDNMESILRGGSAAGQYLDGYEGYGKLIRRVGEVPHQSCLLLTSREKPREIASQEGKGLLVHSLKVSGLKEVEGQQVLERKGLSGSESEFKTLVERYAGNALALKLVATTILDVFNGNIECFLQHGTTFFGDIQELLEQQVERLTTLEKQVMFWLAINREPVSLSEVREDIVSLLPQPKLLQKLLEALESLFRRSLIERSAALVTLQPVVMEFVTARLVEQVCKEIRTQNTNLFMCLALIKAQAKDYIRDTQVRLILKPVIDGLLTVFRNKTGIENQLARIITTLQVTSPSEPEYTTGNIINLLSHLGTDLSNYNFSNLTVRQADLRCVKLRNVNFTNANLANSVFAENFGGVMSVAFSPDGKLLATSDTNGEIRLRQVVDGKQVLTCKAHSNWVTSLAFSPDSRILASSSSDSTVNLWDIDTGQCQTLRGHDNEVWSVAFSPDGETLASGSDDQTIKLWCVHTGECLKTLKRTSLVQSIAYSPDGQTLASGGTDKLVRFWNINTGECFKTLQGHCGLIKSVAFSPDGDKLASGSEDKVVKLWEISSEKCLQTLQEHSYGVWFVSFHPQGDILASGSIDKTVKLWDISSGECLQTLQGHSSWVFSVAFHPHGSLLASASQDQTAKLWEVSTGQCVKTFQGCINQVLSVAYSPDGQTLVSGSSDGTVRLWNVSTGQILRTFQGHRAAVRSVAYSPNEPTLARTLASGSDDQTIILWDVSTGQILRTFQGHCAAVRSVAYSPNGQTLASGSDDRTMRLWDVSTGQTLRIFQGYGASIWSIAYSPDGQTLASGGLEEALKLRDVSTGECRRTLEGHESWAWAVAFSPDGNTLASTSTDQSLRLWSVSTGKCYKIVWLAVWLQLIAFSPDGRILATSSKDLSIMLWDVSTGKHVKTLPGHTSWVWSVTFCPDNKTLATGSEDETIRLWDATTGECLKILTAEKPYQGMNIRGISGLTEATIATLKALGAVD